MGVHDKTCRECGADIRDLFPQAALCEPCYQKRQDWRAEQEVLDRHERKEAFMALPDEDRWEMVWNRLFSG